MNEVIERPKTHLFQKGQSGNPAGRPKGSKNRITLMKIALEGELREQLKYDAAEIMKVAINMAKQGDTAMLKLLIDKMVPTSKASEDEPQKEKIQINIGRLDKGERPVINGEIVEEPENV